MSTLGRKTHWHARHVNTQGTKMKLEGKERFVFIKKILNLFLL